MVATICCISCVGGSEVEAGVVLEVGADVGCVTVAAVDGAAVDGAGAVVVVASFLTAGLRARGMEPDKAGSDAVRPFNN